MSPIPQRGGGASRHGGRRRMAWRAALAVGLLWLGAAATGCAGSKGANVNSNEPVVPGPGERMLYLGRFAFVVPEHVEVGVFEAYLHGARLEEIDWPDAGESGEHATPFERLWAERVAEVEADVENRPSEVASILIRQTEPAPGVRVLLRYFSEFTTSRREAVALRDGGSAGLWSRETYYVDDTPERQGMQEITERKHANLAAAYHAYEGGRATRPIPGAFHLKRGAVALGLDGMESLHAGVVDHSIDASFQIRTFSYQDRESPSAIRRWKQFDREENLIWGTSTDYIRARKRVVAGLPGEEVVVRLRDRDEAVITLEWYYAGEDHSSLRPNFSIEMTTEDGGLPMKLARWDEFLDKVRPVPQDVEP
jgi:hypothetical protein